MLTPDEKKALSERDIISKYILPNVESAGWDPDFQIREEVSFTDGRILVRGERTVRGQRKRADILLYWKPNLLLALVEAKENNQSIGAGMQQALDYGRALDVPFVYSSNGDGFIEHDRMRESGPLERELSLAEFPSPASLWKRYCEAKGLSEPQTKIITQDYYSGGRKKPRYYQEVAVNRTVEAIAKGVDRILLVMATGTGKTYCAFHIIWRLWKAGQKKRILFLADRNMLVDQARLKDFSPFGEVMTKVTGRKVDKAYQIYLALYQQLTGPEESKKAYTEFSADFFDLIVIDECHRGSAAEDSAWREILEYFSGATQIGLTATPRETKYVSNIDYFGKPIFVYTLLQGIRDGFLAPYKVIRIDIDKDLEGWRPTKNQADRHGNLIDDRVYNQKDFDRTMVLTERRKRVTEKITEFLKGTDRMAKTIVFCEDIEHAEGMRSMLVNANDDLYRENYKYVVRITGDNSESEALTYDLCQPGEPYPVIATTSKLLTTGVDAETCKLIVLDRNIGSMTEFKQIIGRGTRLREDFGKTHFTIMDFRRATELFADPNFDGPPIQVYEPGEDDSVVPMLVDEGEVVSEEELEVAPDDVLVIEPFPYSPGSIEDGKRGFSRRKYYVNKFEVAVLGERVQYFDANGKLITESLKDYTQKAVTQEYRTLDEFIKKWSEADRKATILEELTEEGVFLDALAEEVGRDYDPFDLICHVAYGRPPLTRRERANNVKKKNYFGKYSETARKVMESLLEKYADRGMVEVEQMEVLKLKPLNELGTPVEIVKSFGGRDKYMAALREMGEELYASA